MEFAQHDLQCQRSGAEIGGARAFHSAAIRAPFCAAERRISRTRNTSPAAIAASTQTTSKYASERACWSRTFASACSAICRGENLGREFEGRAETRPSPFSTTLKPRFIIDHNPTRSGVITPDAT